MFHRIEIHIEGLLGGNEKKSAGRLGETSEYICRRVKIGRNILNN